MFTKKNTSVNFVNNDIFVFTDGFKSLPPYNFLLEAIEKFVENSY